MRICCLREKYNSRKRYKMYGFVTKLKIYKNDHCRKAREGKTKVAYSEQIKKKFKKSSYEEVRAVKSGEGYTNKSLATRIQVISQCFDV